MRKKDTGRLMTADGTYTVTVPSRLARARRDVAIAFDSYVDAYRAKRALKLAENVFAVVGRDRDRAYQLLDLLLKNQEG